MNVTLMTSSKYSIITLPEKVAGQYWLRHVCEASSSVNLIGIEGVSGRWRLKPGKGITLNDEQGAAVKYAELVPQSVYYLRIAQTGDEACIYTEPVTADRQRFSKYTLFQNSVELNIGRGPENDIVFINKFVSVNHAKILYSAGRFTVTDLGSTNGTYVNEQRIRNAKELRPGDVVYIAGMKIIIGSRFIAVNNPDGKVSITTDSLMPYEAQKAEQPQEDDDEDAPGDEARFFYRSPRFMRDIDDLAEIKVDSPPGSGVSEDTPAMLTIGPALTMGMASMTMGIFMVNNALSTGDISRAIPSIAMSGSMLLGALLWPALSRRFDKRRKARNEDKRQRAYREYLGSVARSIAEACATEEEILHENHVGVAECMDRIRNLSHNLWERGYGQADFLKLRIGLGTAHLSSKVSYSARKFAVDEDVLTEEMLRLCESPKTLSNVPMLISLYESYFSGFVGERNVIEDFAKGLIIQLVSFYSYDEVKLVFLLDESGYDKFKFVKWLPHVWSNDARMRFAATSIKEAKEITAYLEDEINMRAQSGSTKGKRFVPHYIIFTMSKELGARADLLKQVFAYSDNLHISVLSFCGELKDLPKETMTVVELNGDSGKMYDKNDMTGKHIPFVPDIYVSDDLVEQSVMLANIPLDILEGSNKLPSMLTFLEMFGVGKAEHLNALTRWKENDPTTSLEASVGVNILGDAFKLDLHEKFHGPHGLVAGMTGSGKSEFIITYILSMAVNYHPHEVAFILIDYKGGGMAKAFETLPHTAGIITNLDGAAVTRSLVSIESELKRRQAIFAEAGRKIGISNIDIYKYQKIFREGSVTEPLQHLIIISDEFAELKTQQPEFMQKLISTARIGRSLGVHLILATQKPSGVVDDQIWSNSRFRVCLKVQERADSNDMLKRPDAAELSDTGRFYMQVGYNEFFEIGQSAWAGAPYYPAEKVTAERDSSVTVIDINGRPMRQARIAPKHDGMPGPKKQLDVITAYLEDLVNKECIKARPLWLDPMPFMITVDGIREKYGIKDSAGFVLSPVIGEYDDPASQMQHALRLPLSMEGNAVVYGITGGGKSTFLSAAVYSLMKEHTPDEVNIYMLDFASETLRAFSKAPHVGDVVVSHEAEKISNLFKMLQREVEQRKRRFADSGGDYQSYVSSGGEKLPSIVVMINNYEAFTEIYPANEESVALLSREGTKYGIFFILTVSGVSSVRYKMQQNFKQHFVMQLNAESDYVTVLGRTNGLFPTKAKGRGLFKTDAVYEFQTAHITEEALPYGYISDYCRSLGASWKGSKAASIPLLPEHVSICLLSGLIKDRCSLRVPIGVERASLNAHWFDFSVAFAHMVLSASDEHYEFAGTLARMMASACDFDVTVFDLPGKISGMLGEAGSYCSDITAIGEAIDGLLGFVDERRGATGEPRNKNSRTIRHKVLVINSCSALKSALPTETYGKLARLLENGGNYSGITAVIAESAKALTLISGEQWYKRHVTQSGCIWIGSGFTSQYTMVASKTTPEMREDIGPDFGISLVKGAAVIIKVLNRVKAEESQDG